MIPDRQIEVLATFEWEEGHAPSETFGDVLNEPTDWVNCSGTFEESPCMGFAGDNLMGPILPVETNSVTMYMMISNHRIHFQQSNGNGYVRNTVLRDSNCSVFVRNHQLEVKFNSDVEVA